MLPGAVQHQFKAVLGATDFQEDAVAPVREFVHVQLPTKTGVRAVLFVQNPVLFVFDDYAQLATLSGGELKAQTRKIRLAICIAPAVG